MVGTGVDGAWGPKTRNSVAAALGCAADNKAIQRAVGVHPDGIIGAKTIAAIYKAVALKKGTPEVAKKVTEALDIKTITQREIRSGNSVFGKAGTESDMVFVKPPYTIYYDGKPYSHGVKVHKLVAPSLEKIFKEIYDTYGPEKIHELHMDVYAGAYYVKKVTGGSLPSIHSWGCAIDWWPEANALKTKAPNAGFSKDVYKKWWEIWEKHGWVSLGRTCNYDWMHVQVGKL